MLGVLAAAAAGAAALSAGRSEDADAYQVTNAPSTDFAGPIRATGGNSTFPDGAANIGNNTGSGIGVYGTTNGQGIDAAGVFGSASGASQGVLGSCLGTAGRDGSCGVLGISDVGVGVRGGASAGGGIGVFGSGRGIGVEGENAAGGTGVLGSSSFGSGNANVGVYGQAQGSGGGFGVIGLCSNDVNSTGLLGASSTGTGLSGLTYAANGVGVYGYNATSGAALVAVSTGGYAGIFSGSMYVSGALTVLGAKSAAVRDAGGALRRMYSMESPESWFEDFGSGQLTSGTATVQFEPSFGSLVHGDSYHVFLTPKGDSKGWLYVSKQNPNGFTVQEAGGGTSNIGFSYRIVAKRKDIPGNRLEHVDEPALPQVPSKPSAPTITPTSPPKLPS
jgi:hypothetical protein